MPETTLQQMSFGGGLNAISPPHLLGEDQVQTATNIDFSFERGAACVRRGSKRLYSVGSDPIYRIARFYNQPNALSSSPFYVACGSAVYRGTGTTFTSIISAGANALGGFTSYRGNCYITVPNGTLSIKDNGTSSTDWVPQAPATAPTITVSTLTPLVVCSTWTVAEGTSTETMTATNTCTATCHADTLRLQLNGTPTSTNLNLNGTETIGDYGTDYLEIAFSNPTYVQRVSRDYSIGDTNFTNYYHTEMDVVLSTNVPSSVSALLASQLAVGTSSTTALDSEIVSAIISQADTSYTEPVVHISAAANTFNVWAVPRTKFELICKDGTNAGWADIKAVRVLVESAEATIVTIKSWDIRGAQSYPLNDANVGYSYYETFATLDTNSNIINESAPGPVSASVKVQQARASVVGATSPTGAHGMTHRVLYRQGGYLGTPYAIATNTLATTTYTDNVSDVQALTLQHQLESNFLPRASFPNNVMHISEPFYERLIVAYGNEIRWSLPNKPGCFPSNSCAAVSHSGDEIHGLVTWPPGVIIINRDSVYELIGSFDASENDVSLRRTGSRHGSKARGVVIKTPHGIPLLDYDGLYLYVPGQGSDQPIPWASEALQDVFKGANGDDPAALKGNRIAPALPGYLNEAVAAYADDKLYLGVATGTHTDPSSIYVLDFRTQRVWGPYTYPFNITTLYWDFVSNVLMAGTPDGKIMQIEVGASDQTTAASTQGITYSFKTRAWTAPSDAVLENLAIEVAGTSGTASAIVDGTTTYSLGTCSGTGKDWLIPSLGGAVGNNVVFSFHGTQGTNNQVSYYGVEFDALVEPKRVTFHKSDYEVPNPQGETLWDVHFSHLEIPGTSTVSRTSFVDGTAVMTKTLVGPTAGMIQWQEAYPADTIGETSYAQFSGGPFKLWKNYSTGRAEPPRVRNVSVGPHSYPSSQSLKTWVAELNPLGTCYGTLLADGTAISTATFTGTRHTTFNVGIDVNTSYGTLTAIDLMVYYNGSGTTGVLKHYSTQFEVVPKPFGKSTWKFTYKRPGGASQLDIPRFHSIEAEPVTGTCTLTGIWDIDGTATLTETLTFTGREWKDRIDFPAGMRGYDFRLRLRSSAPIMIWKTSMDFVQVGVKGLVRRTFPGTPEE